MAFTDRLKIAGKELSRANVGSAVKTLFSSTPIHPGNYRGGTGDLWLFNGAGGSDVCLSFSDLNSAIKAYSLCAPLNAIINRKAQAYINGKTWLLNKKDGKEATGPTAERIKKLLQKPNPLQSWKQFEAQGYIYRQICGYTVVLPIKPVGFDGSYATKLWNIPPSMLDIKEKERVDLFNSNSAKDFIESIHLVAGTTRTELPLDDVFIIKDFSPSFNSFALPVSRVKAHKDQVNTILSTYESLGVLINRRGPMSIFSSDKSDADGTSPLTDPEKKQLQEDFQRYGLLRNQWQQIITSAAIKVQTVGFATKDLMLFEGIEDAIMRLCDGYGYPFYLISSGKGVTFSNLKDAKTLLYQDTTIPEAESDYEQWTEFFGQSELRVDKDYSHVPALQEDKRQNAQARKTLNEALKIEFEQGLITIDQWLEKLGEDPLPNGLGKARATDPKSSNAPLAVIIGVGGVQSMISVLTAPGMSEEARRNTLEILFGIAPADAARMVIASEQTESQNSNSNTQNGNSE